jgi:hypothetical protein
VFFLLLPVFGHAQYPSGPERLSPVAVGLGRPVAHFLSGPNAISTEGSKCCESLWIEINRLWSASYGNVAGGFEVLVIVAGVLTSNGSGRNLVRAYVRGETGNRPDRIQMP